MVKFVHNSYLTKTYFSSALGSFVLVVTSHNFTVQSADPDARRVPSQLTNPTTMKCRGRVTMGIYLKNV